MRAKNSEEQKPGRVISKNVPVMIKKLRALMGLTQEQFSHVVGVTFATVNRWEAGKTKPSPLALRRIEELRENLLKTGKQ